MKLIVVCDSVLLNRVIRACITLDVVHDFRLEKQCTLASCDEFFNPLKQCVTLLFHMITGSLIFSPTSLMEKAMVNV